MMSVNDKKYTCGLKVNKQKINGRKFLNTQLDIEFFTTWKIYGEKNHVYSSNLDKPMFEDFHNFEQEFIIV